MTDVDPLSLVASTADAAFATDEEGRIVIWNRPAEELFGHPAADVLGRACHEVLCGRDLFGNRFCDEGCVLERMVRRREAIRRFEIDVRRKDGRLLRIGVSVVVVPGPRGSQHSIVHLVAPTDAPATAGGPVPDSFALPLAPPDEPAQAPLTIREAEVLRLLADGRGTTEVADLLFISVTTVRNHVQNIPRKLDVHSKVEAVSLALRNRWI